MIALNGLEFLDTVRAAIGVETLSGAKTLIVTDYVLQWLDPDGTDRDVNLPAEASSVNLMFIIVNTANGAGEDLVVKDDTPATVGTLGPGMTGIFSCDGTNWKCENDTGMFYDSVSGYRGIGTLTPDTLLQIANDCWLSGKNYAGTAPLNMFQPSTGDQINVGAALNIGMPIEGPEDGGMIKLVDMPISATPATTDEQSFTMGIDGDGSFVFGAFPDSAGGAVGHFVRMLGAVMHHRTDQGSSDYNPSTLTSDYIIIVDNSAAARAVTISTEDVQSGSLDDPRFFIITDEEGTASTYNITVSLESGNIDKVATAVIKADGNSITLYVDGTNGHIV